MGDASDRVTAGVSKQRIGGGDRPGEYKDKDGDCGLNASFQMGYKQLLEV